MKKKHLVLFVREMIVFIFQVAFSRLQIYSSFSFGFPFAIMRIFFGGNLMIVALEFFVANLFFYSNFYLMVSMTFEIVVLSLYYFFKEMFKINKKRLCVFLFLILSTMLKLYFVAAGVMDWRVFLFESILKCIALWYFIKNTEIYKKKFVFYRCGSAEYLSFSLFLILFVLGLFSYGKLTEIFGLFLITLALIAFCRILPLEKFLVLAISMCLSFGYVFASYKIVSLLILAALLLIALSKAYKYLYLSYALLISFLILKFSGFLTIKNFVSVFIADAFMICIPQKIINKLAALFENKKNNFILDNLWIEKERDVKQKLFIMSKTFLKMREDFRFLMVGKIDRKNAATELAKDIIKNDCSNCENFRLCANTLIDKQKLISEYIYYAIEKGSVSLEEISVGFRTYCNQTNFIVRDINKISRQYLAFEANMKYEDESKLLVSTEFENIARIFDNFAKNINICLKPNKSLSVMAKEYLTNAMIDVYDIGVFENDKGVERIDIVVGNEVAMRKELVDALSAFTRTKVQIQKIKHIELSGLSYASFVIDNNLTAEFAYSAQARDGINGDSVLISRIDKDRFLLAIADGMGHGKLAGRTSKMVLELIKNLFIVGVELDLIIDSINKLLLPAGIDNFSTLDMAVVDLKQQICSFIKLGASVSLIKHSQTTDVIAGKSLPVGIVQNLKPTIITRKIVDGDIIILASDGVVDSYGEIEKYKIFVNDFKIDNLQMFVDNTIFEIENSNQSHKDDMSIIALKLLKNLRK